MADSLLDLGTVTTIFDFVPDWSSTPSAGQLFGREILQNNNGIARVRALTSDLPRNVEYSYFNIDKETEFDLLTFFSTKRGRLKKFWLPVIYQQFELSVDIASGDGFVNIVDNKYCDVARYYERIFIKLKNGDMITRKAESVDVGSRTKFIVRSPFDRDIAIEDVLFFGLLLLVRFDQDEIEVDHITRDLSETSLAFYELPKEYEILPPLDAPILWWKGENNTVESVNGVDASWLITPAYESGQVGQCFRTVVSVINVFDIKTALTVANNPLFDFGPSDSFSVRFWFKQNSNPVSNTHIISMGPWWANNQSNWSIQLDEAGSLFITREGGYLPANSVGQITDTNWHDILMTYSDATWQFFVDGVDNGEAAIHFNGLHISTIPNLDLLIMGLRAGLPSTFDGSIDEIKIFDKVIIP